MATPIPFNVTWYLSQNPDVAAAVEAGLIDAETHFQQFGRFEGRSASFLLDVEYYLANNPDVAEAVQAGTITAWDHAVQFGMSEGRVVTRVFDEAFYLQSNPDIAQAVASGQIQSGLQHFVLFGHTESRPVNPVLDLDRYLEANPDVAEAAAAGVIDPLAHLMTYGITEGRSLGNGIQLPVFDNDPLFTGGLTANNHLDAWERVKLIAPFVPTFERPAGWTPPADTPIPVDFVPPAGSDLKLVVPPEVVVPPGVTLPDQVFAPGNGATPTPAPNPAPAVDDGPSVITVNAPVAGAELVFSSNLPTVINNPAGDLSVEHNGTGILTINGVPDGATITPSGTGPVVINTALGSNETAAVDLANAGGTVTLDNDGEGTLAVTNVTGGKTLTLMGDGPTTITNPAGSLDVINNGTGIVTVAGAKSNSTITPSGTGPITINTAVGHNETATVDLANVGGTITLDNDGEGTLAVTNVTGGKTLSLIGSGTGTTTITDPDGDLTVENNGSGIATVTGLKTGKIVTVSGTTPVAVDLSHLGSGDSITINNTGTGTVSLLNKPFDVTVNFGEGTGPINAAPTLAITSNVGALKAGETAIITFTFSEAPKDFAVEDIITTGGTLSNLTVDSQDTKIYTATFTPTAELASGTASITVAAGTYKDADGNSGGAGATPAITIDTQAPDAPINVTLTPVGGTVVANTVNTTNTHLEISATITAGQAAGGKAEFYVGEVKVGEVTSIAAEATAVQFTTADSDPTNVELQASITAGGVVTVKLFDAAGNHATSSVDNPTLVVGYAAPSPSAFTATATAVGATSNAAGLLGLYSNDNLLPDGASGTLSTNLTANIPATITVAPRGSITSATLKVSDAAGNFATDTRNVVLGTTSNETLNGTSGKDFIYGFAGNDTLSGGDGDDTLLGGDGDDNLTGGADNDTFKVDAGTDTITDLATGDIFVVGGPSPESSASMTANNVANFVATNQTQGSHYVGSVTLNAAAAGSTIDVSLASVVHGFTLVGSDGVDNLTGTTANDTITGGAGADVLTGGAGNDTLTGGVDNDTFNVDAGTDTITDLTTGDVLVVSSGATANATNITAFTASSGTVQSGTATLSTADAGGTINVAATSGSTGFTLNGGNGVDNLTGSGAADIINGGAGNDVLNGGAGNDTITGGAGADAINVGTGTDLVVLRDNDSAANNETGSSVSTSGMDIYTGLGVGDQLEIYRSITFNYFGSVKKSTSSVGGVDDAIMFTRGTYNAGNNTFTASANGTDSLVTYDVLIDYKGGTDYESIVLVGFVGESDRGFSSSGRGATVTLSDFV